MNAALFFLIGIFSWVSYFSGSFVYPIASFNDKKLFVMYQKSDMQVELWIWDLQELQALKGLPNHITPAGVKLLPCGKGFSFVDQGRIRIKYFGKRSPKSIEVSEPIYDIALIEWINDDTCYLSARQHNHYGIYHLYTSGTVVPLLWDCTVDNMYPQKQNDMLFYIERSRAVDTIRRNGSYQYRIMQTTYPTVPQEESFDFENTVIGTTEHENVMIGKKSVVIDNHKNPLIFLRMMSEHEGYVIEHQATINEHDTCIECVYHHLFYKDNQWQMAPLICFSLPIKLLFKPKTRLYESILPLLPYHVGSTIYYVDCSHAKNVLNLNIFSYDTKTKKQTQLTHATEKNAHYFGPFRLGNTIFYGGSLESCLCSPPECTPSSEGFITFNLGRLYV